MKNGLAITIAKFQYWWIVLLGVVALILPITYSNAATTYKDDYLKAHHQDSLLLYENYIQRQGVWAIDDCFSTGKIITDASVFNTVCMPDFISSTTNSSQNKNPNCNLSVAGDVTLAAGLRIAFLGLTLLAAGFEVLIMMDICTNAYIIQPHEYINRKEKRATCQVSGGFIAYTPTGSTPPLTIDDVPFFYHCDPLWDPSANNGAGGPLPVGSTDPAVAAKIGRTWGYMGAASQYCIGNSATTIKPYKDLVGAVVVEMLPGATKVMGQSLGGWGYCKGPVVNKINSDNAYSDGRYSAIIKPGMGVKTVKAYVDLAAYYQFLPEQGKTKICVAAPYTMFPVQVGCGYVAPPGEDAGVNEFLKTYVSNTRCAYLIDKRTDLNSLGTAMFNGGATAIDDAGNDRTAVAKFLQSELHITSTVVGCIKDMLQKIFIKAPTNFSNGSIATTGPLPFFQVVQLRLKQIILAVLVLYVSIVGVRIMTSPQVPQKAEFIMWLIKYGLVMYFALGDAFYAVDSSGNVVGLYPQLLSVSDEIANLFLAAQNQYDPIGYCTYIKGGKNVLGERMIDPSVFSNLTPTSGYSGVKMTVWDLVDCKLINYLNGGSCSYTLDGLVLVWISSLSLFVSGGDGILLAIVTFIYCFLILLVIFKFAHIFILAAIVITILLFLAPIFVCFFLFETTKGIFDKWMKVIFGYMLYPALLFAFLALMLATLDSIYYGTLNTTTTIADINGNPSGGTQLGKQNLKTMCKGVDSLFCSINAISNFDQDMCRQPMSYFYNAWVEPFSTLGQTFNRASTDAFTLFSKHMTKLMLFALLFFLFMNAAADFMAALLSVQSINMAKGGINAMDVIGSVVGAAASSMKKVAGSATKDPGK